MYGERSLCMKVCTALRGNYGYIRSRLAYVLRFKYTWYRNGRLPRGFITCRRVPGLGGSIL